MHINSTLYKQSAKDAVQQWEVFVEGNKITVEYGQVGGKKQTKDTHCKGKNTGKANATTDNEQAIAEALSKWEKQVKKGYVEDPSGARLVLLPMKVESYFKTGMKDKLQFPCTSSPKLNGVNGECRLLPDGSIVQLSRGGEMYPLPFTAATHELKTVMVLLNVTSLNYEIYKHGEYLQDITGAVKAPDKHKTLWEKLEYHIFDLPSYNTDWRTRRALLESARVLKCSYVHIVPSVEVHSHEELISRQDEYVSKGYEGSIVRNYKGLYTYNTRSSDVFKVKYTTSEEFLVHSYFTDKNNQPVFWCKSKGGLFKVKPKGTDQQRANILAQAPSWVDKWMTVEFESYSKDKKPLKPVGIGLRAGTVDDRGVFTPKE
jgi:ATP-dependent DNA ligase